MWLALLTMFACGLSDCEALCAREADCIERDLDDFDSDWESFTGFSDREAFEGECLQIWEEGRELGGRRRKLQRICRAELEQACP